MSLASPENELERRVAAQVDSLYGAAWDEAIDAAVNTIATLQSKDGPMIIEAVLALKR